MSSPRRKEKGANSNQTAMTSSPRSGRSLRSRRKIDSIDEEDREDLTTGRERSLNVLAQVASETLENEPKPQRRKRKMTMRHLQTLDSLNLEQISELSERNLMMLFADNSANEMTRNFTFTCCLMPKKCREKFTSFGNEERARSSVSQHLLEHIEQLKKEAKDLGTKFKFTAEPVHTRDRKLSELCSTKKRKNATIKKGPPLGSVKFKELSGKYTALKHSHAQSESNSDGDRSCEEESCDENTDGSLSPKHSQKLSHKHSKSVTENSNKPNSDTDTSDQDNTVKRIEENEQFIIDLLSRTQPHHDHCYTTIFGKRKGIDKMHFDLDSSENEEEDHMDVGNSSYNPIQNIITGLPEEEETLKNKNDKRHPILFLRHRSPDENVPMVSKEEIISESTSEEEYDAHSGQKPYPPMPKSALAQKGRIPIPEEFELLSGSEGEVDTKVTKKKKNSKTGNWLKRGDGGLEWEPKLALKYIRDLKNKKKDEKFSLRCKICKDKTFTAAATLMYHYRSHAGIKPFVCLICNTTFTRQHSLNYHMLIHNNQSRFTCKDCGRKFRHPSHFKEHLRRHTGETPFECMDCGQKFKTRNTYKRHLKTRHGKLLTATGIHQMSKEEFARVRTRPHKGFKYYSTEMFEKYEKLDKEFSEAMKAHPNLTPIPDSLRNSINRNGESSGRKQHSESDTESDEDLSTSSDSESEDDDEEEDTDGTKEDQEESDDGKEANSEEEENNSLYVPVGIVVKS
ncbi:hypothetical protein ACJMK2_035902 [Sinanodonta woodiana]|uniref:C2H2-type domain-containing protein n=1 Tax=Sinanodonta woodiana TaxID=1069815 RepID=A0ABD3WIW3_SINWO